MVGDFVWPGFGSEIVVADRVLAALQSRFTGFEPGPIEMIEEPDLLLRDRRRVTLPYTGPALHELWTTSWVDADLKRSTVELESKCAQCGMESWRVDGIEHWDSVFDPQERRLIRTRVPRIADSGVYIRAVDLRGADIFRVRQLPGWVFCTDPVRDLVLERGFSNADFLEMGDAM